MRLEDFEMVRALRGQLADAADTLDRFRQCPHETVSCLAHFDGGDYGRIRSASVEVLPIPTSQAISSAQRAYNKIVDQLAQLGVTVNPDAKPVRADLDS